jgi:hypothetical protein
MRREGDEWFCPDCSKRWGTDDDTPTCGREPLIIGICGRAGSGKSTAAEHLIRRHGFERVKFAGPLKAMTAALLEQMGAGEPMEFIEGVFKETPIPALGDKTTRHVMQTLGTEWGRDVMGEDFWVNLARARIQSLIEDGHNRIVIDDVRFENEAQMIRDLGGNVVALTDRGVEVGNHPSEGGVPWDMQYQNTGSIAELTGWFDYVFMDKGWD